MDCIIITNRLPLSVEIIYGILLLLNPQELIPLQRVHFLYHNLYTDPIRYAWITPYSRKDLILETGFNTTL